MSCDAPLRHSRFASGGRGTTHLLSLLGMLSIWVALTALPTTAQVSQDTVFPGEEWEVLGRNRQTLEEYGWSAAGLRGAW